jgi:hypothetical protein
MWERQQSSYDSTARKWLALVERRQQHFIELCNTGHWRHYYTHAQFLEEMRKVLHLRNQWARLAGVSVSEQTEFHQSIKQSRSGAGQRRRPASAILAAVAARL